jgi:hypothetical protein
VDEEGCGTSLEEEEHLLFVVLLDVDGMKKQAVAFKTR